MDKPYSLELCLMASLEEVVIVDDVVVSQHSRKRVEEGTPTEAALPTDEPVQEKEGCQANGIDPETEVVVLGRHFLALGDEKEVVDGLPHITL